MLLVFQVFFIVGITLTFISFIFGSLFDFMGIDGIDLDLGSFSIDFFLPLSPSLYLLFATIFGGSGMILMGMEYQLPSILIIFAAFVMGVISMILLNQLVIKPLKRAQNTSIPDAEELIGLQATVTEKIISKGFGEITYVIHGNSFTSPSKSVNEEEIKVGSKVAICWIKDYIFYVSLIDL